MSDVRKPAVAGLFYSGDKLELENDITKMLDQTNDSKEYKNVFGLVVPHAGYIYSGQTAAYAYNTIRNQKYKRVIVLSPSHREYFQGSSIYYGDAYKTPLGEIKIDNEFRDLMIEKGSTIFASENGHNNEHALEVQLPFLQTVLDDFELVPIVMGDQRQTYIDDLAEVLSTTIDEETLLVASTDLSHFHSKEKANELDILVENTINNFDFEKLQKDLELENCSACGGGLVVTLLKTASLLGKNNAKVLKRTDSGDVTGDKSEVVGYLSAVVN